MPQLIQDSSATSYPLKQPLYEFTTEELTFKNAFLFCTCAPLLQQI